uniref:Uncharacterized protein n=1 Tax=Salix viminalis TaxID=40686 RepID=A0A6N2KHW8_SALVM
MERDVGRSGNSSRGSKKRKMWLLKLKDSWRWRLKFLGSAFKWKRLNIHTSFFDDLIFKLVLCFRGYCLGYYRFLRSLWRPSSFLRKKKSKKKIELCLWKDCISVVLLLMQDVHDGNFGTG